MDAKFWGALAGEVAEWDAAYEAHAVHSRENNGRRVTREESMILMLKERGLKAGLDRAFLAIMQRCSFMLARDCLSLTAADLEKELRSRELPVCLLAEAMDPKGPEAAAGLRVMRNGRPAPFLVNFVVTRNPSYLLSERIRAIKSCLKSPSLTDNQRQQAETSLNEAKDPNGLISLNMELLLSAGFRMAPETKKPGGSDDYQQLVDDMRRQNVRGLQSVQEIQAAARAGDLISGK